MASPRAGDHGAMLERHFPMPVNSVSCTPFDVECFDVESDPGPLAIAACPVCRTPQRIVRWTLGDHQRTDPATGETAACEASGWGLVTGRLILPESNHG